MKKLILAGVIIIIGCLVFIIIQQNSSQADIGMDMFRKPYPVEFGDWVRVYLSAVWDQDLGSEYFLRVGVKLIPIGRKFRFKITVAYNSNTEIGKQWYQETFPEIKEGIRKQCRYWTLQGYPISLNDFEFDIRTY